MKAAKTQKKLKKCLIHRKKKKNKKKTNAPISQTSSERLKLTIQTDRMRDKT